MVWLLGPGYSSKQTQSRPTMSPAPICDESGARQHGWALIWATGSGRFTSGHQVDVVGLTTPNLPDVTRRHLVYQCSTESPKMPLPGIR